MGASISIRLLARTPAVLPATVSANGLEEKCPRLNAYLKTTHYTQSGSQKGGKNGWWEIVPCSQPDLPCRVTSTNAVGVYTSALKLEGAGTQKDKRGPYFITFLSSG